MRLASFLVSVPDTWEDCRLTNLRLSGRILPTVPEHGMADHCTTDIHGGRQECATCRMMDDSGCIMDSADRREDGLIRWNVVAPNSAALRGLMKRAQGLGCKVRIERMSVLRTARELTTAQERVMQIAFDMGYFDIPKRITLDELSRRLGMPKTKLDVVLRRAQRKLTASHVGSVD